MNSVQERRTVTAAANTQRADALRQRIRARYPVLKDGALLGPGGPSAAFSRNLLDLALRSVRPVPGAAARAAAWPFDTRALQNLTRSLDATPPHRQESITRISLTEVGPHQVYAYWSVPDPTLAHVRARLGEMARTAALTLRFYEVTRVIFDGSNALQTFDIDLETQERSRYIDIWGPDKTYVVDLGLRAPDGRFIALARSRSAHVPRVDAAQPGEQRLLRLEENRLPIVRPGLPARFRVAADPVIVGEGEPDWALRDLEAERLVRAAYRAFLAEGPRVFRNLAPIRRRDPLILRDEYTQREARRRSQTVSPSRSDTPPLGRKPLPDLFYARLDAPAEPASDSGLTYPPMLRTLAQPQRPPVCGMPPAARLLDLAARLGEQPLAQPSRLALAAPRALPRLAAPAPKKRAAVRLQKSKNIIDALAAAGVELEAELILRGRVQPGKKVRIGNRIIDTNADGTFCVSCVIRDGKLHVPVEVVEAEMVVARQEFTVAIHTPARPTA